MTISQYQIGVYELEFKGAIPETSLVLPKFNNGHWTFEEQMGTTSHCGFIYVIRDKALKMLYLGKKTYRSNGKLKAGTETNWRKYKSSSPVLKEMWKERPIYDEFEFICIEQYKMKGALGYAETWSLCHVEAPTKDHWYNRLVEKVAWNVKEGITDRHRARLDAAVNWEDFDEN